MPVLDIYIGGRIEHDSDRAVLKTVVTLLAGDPRPAVVLANVHFAGRQIDLVVGLPDKTLVIEAKSYRNPVRGDTNGPWAVQVASGAWKPIANLYQQTLDAKLALRDAMSAFSQEHVGYPAAALVFCPTVPDGSSIGGGNFKVAQCGLDQLEALLNAESSSPWPIDQWRAFATHHRLERVNDVGTATDPSLIDAERLLSAYRDAFRRTYAPPAEPLVNCAWRENGAPSLLLDVARRATAGASFLLRGPSGCGKTLSLYRTGVDCLAGGRVPIFIYGKDFDGKLREAMDREAVLLDIPGVTPLVAAARLLGLPLTLLIDGYNECRAELREKLTRSVAAASRRLEASVVVTAQGPLARADLLPVPDIDVIPPDTDAKLAIANNASADSVPDTALKLLETIESGLEARLIGESILSVAPGASRYGVFDAFVRKRLEDEACEAIRLLACIAEHLCRHVSFSLSLRDLDRLAESANVSPSIIRRLLRCKILAQRGDRASFAHEMFLDAFAAEAVIRSSGGDAGKILAALQTPIHAKRGVLIVGAIDDPQLLTAVLDGIGSASLVEACLSGQCGAVARDWAERRCNDVLARLQAEADAATFAIDAKAWMGVAAHEGSLAAWSKPDWAVIGALPQVLVAGRQVDAVMTIIASLDRQLANEEVRLRDEAKAREVAVRSGLFGTCYAQGSPRGPAIGSIVAPFQSGMVRGSETDSVANLLKTWLPREDLTPGQVYLLLGMNRAAAAANKVLAAHLPDILRRFWPRAAYHLKLDMLYAAQFSARASEAGRKAIIDALQELPQPQHIFLSSTLVEALQSLGALDEDENEYVDTVRDQIRMVLANPGDPDLRQVAAGIWMSCFDHPYSAAHYEAVEVLEPADRKALLAMAAHALDIESSFMAILLVELASYGDPALGTVISRWTALPPLRCMIPQEAVENFIVSHIALARLQRDMPDNGTDGLTDSQKSLRACAEILYWVNRCDLPQDRRLSACEAPLAVLLTHETGTAVSCLRAIWHAFHSFELLGDHRSRKLGQEPVLISVASSFPEEVAEMCRACLKHPDRQKGYFDYFELREALTFAISMLGQYGTLLDIAMLREFARQEQLGSWALDAIRCIEDRLMTARLAG